MAHTGTIGLKSSSTSAAAATLARGERREGALPEVTVLAGPNGAGKSTAFTRLVNVELEFLSADYEDGGVWAQGKTIIRRRIELENQQKSFCVEVTLAARNLKRWIQRWRDLGYTTRLIFISVPHPDLAVARVAGRQQTGGHGIPGGEATIRRRYFAGLNNFYEYRNQFDYWAMYDNTDLDGPRPVAHGEVADWAAWKELDGQRAR